MVKKSKIAPKETIRYFGEVLNFVTETDSMDEAQALLDHFRNQGYSAACTHKRFKHQVYRKKREK